MQVTDIGYFAFPVPPNGGILSSGDGYANPGHCFFRKMTNNLQAMQYAFLNSSANYRKSYIQKIVEAASHSLERAGLACILRVDKRRPLLYCVALPLHHSG